MKPQTRWPRKLIIAGLIGLLVGAVDPLEGSVIILPSTAVAALGAAIAESRYRRTLYAALILVFVGVAAMWVLSKMGGFGGRSGRSVWWGLLLLPYPVGWVLALVGTGLVFAELRRQRFTQTDST